jgi:Tfp pilus assembly protein PilV
MRGLARSGRGRVHTHRPALGLGLPEGLLALALMALAVLITLKSQQHLQLMREAAARQSSAGLQAAHLVEALRVSALTSAPWECPEPPQPLHPQIVSLTLHAQTSTLPGLFHVRVQVHQSSNGPGKATTFTLQTLMAPEAPGPPAGLHCLYSFALPRAAAARPHSP